MRHFVCNFTFSLRMLLDIFRMSLLPQGFMPFGVEEQDEGELRYLYSIPSPRLSPSGCTKIVCALSAEKRATGPFPLTASPPVGEGDN